MLIVDTSSFIPSCSCGEGLGTRYLDLYKRSEIWRVVQDVGR